MYPSLRSLVYMAGLIVWRCMRISPRKEACKRIYPGAGAQVWARIYISGVRVGASRAKMRAAYAVTAKATNVAGQSSKRMFHRGLSNLFEPFSVAGSAAHAEEILRNHRVVVIWQRKPIQVHSSGIARVC